MLEKQWVVGPFQCNCRLLACPETGEAVIIDAGDEAPRLLAGLSQQVTQQGAKIRVKYLLHTHGHLDHIGATREIHESLGEKPKIALHSGDEFLYRNLKMQ